MNATFKDTFLLVKSNVWFPQTFFSCLIFGLECGPGHFCYCGWGTIVKMFVLHAHSVIWFFAHRVIKMFEAVRRHINESIEFLKLESKQDFLLLHHCIQGFISIA